MHENDMELTEEFEPSIDSIRIYRNAAGAASFGFKLHGKLERDASGEYAMIAEAARIYRILNSTWGVASGGKTNLR